jgi:hypothetical protein
MNRNTNFRPTSEGQFRQALSDGIQLWTECVSCGSAFQSSNVYTPEGWKETQISGYCECCFDKLFEE